MANMVAAFLGNAVDAGIIFEKLAIAINIMLFTLISAKFQGIVQITDSISPVYRMGLTMTLPGRMMTFQLTQQGQSGIL